MKLSIPLILFYIFTILLLIFINFYFACRFNYMYFIFSKKTLFCASRATIYFLFLILTHYKLIN